MNADRHDVTRSPLSPYWQAKVDAASRAINAERRRDTRRPGRPRPERYERIPKAGRGNERLFADLWNAGVPRSAIAEVLDLSSEEAVRHLAGALRANGMLLLERRGGWAAPAGWQDRLDEILAADG